MTAKILKGPSREELAQAMFFSGKRVEFTLRMTGGAELKVSAVVTEAQSDGTYKDEQRNGVVLKGNCCVVGRTRSTSFEAVYDMSAVPDAEDPFMGRFETK